MFDSVFDSVSQAVAILINLSALLLVVLSLTHFTVMILSRIGFVVFHILDGGLAGQDDFEPMSYVDHLLAAFMASLTMMLICALGNAIIICVSAIYVDVFGA